MKTIFLTLFITLFCTILLAQSDPSWVWAKGGGTVNVDNGRSITTDNLGNTYITGFFNGEATFGDLTITAPEGSTSSFVVKLDPNGNWLWARSTTGVGSVTAYGITNDGNGNCYITGEFWGDASFGSIPLSHTGAAAVFVAMIDATGNWLWATPAPGNDYGEDRGYGIDADDSGNCYVTGYIKGNATFGMTTLNTNSGDDSAIFIAKITAGGVWEWAVSGGGSSWSDHATGYGVAYGGGHVYATGYFMGNPTFGEYNTTAIGQSDILLVALNSNGGWEWAHGAGSNFSEVGNAVAADQYGNCYVTGYFNLTTTFGDLSLTATGGQADAFVLKTDSSANCLWAVRAGGWGDDQGRGIAVDNAGNCYIAGQYLGESDFGSFTLPGHGTSLVDTFAAKLDTNGNWVWADGAGDVHEDWGFDVSCDDIGNCYVIGPYSEQETFGSIVITGNTADIFVAKHDSGVVSNEDQSIVSNHASCMKVYPNPFHRGDEISVNLKLDSHDTGSLKLFNIRGQLVGSYSITAGSDNIRFRSDTLTPGIYFCQLQTRNVTEVKKLMLLQ